MDDDGPKSRVEENSVDAELSSAPHPSNSRVAVVSAILGAISVALLLLPGIGWLLSPQLAIVTLILARIGMRQTGLPEKKGGRKAAISGLVLGLVAIIGVLSLLVIASIFDNPTECQEAANRQEFPLECEGETWYGDEPPVRRGDSETPVQDGASTVGPFAKVDSQTLTI